MRNSGASAVLTFVGLVIPKGEFRDFTLVNGLKDSLAVVEMIADGLHITIVGSSLGGWLA